MQTHLIDFSSKKALQEMLASVDTNKKSVLVQIFSSLSKKSKLEKIIKTVTKAIPGAVVIGTSASGEITGEGFGDGGVLLSVTLFDDTRIQSVLVRTTEEIDALKESVVTEETKAMILYSSGFSQNGNRILDHFAALNQKMVIAGGFAGDRGEEGGSYVVCGDAIETEATVALFLSGKNLHATASNLFNWKPVGKRFTITECRDNVIYRTEGRSIRELYREYLGEMVAGEMPESASQFPILIKHKEGVQAHIPLKKIGGGCLFSGSIREGDCFSFGFGNIPAIKQAARDNFDKLAAQPCESIFVFAGSARRTFLPVSIKKEIRPLAALGKVSGFFGSGEYFKDKTGHRFCNLSTTILSLAETDRIPKALYRFELKKGESDYTRSMGGLAHLISKTTGDLEASSALLRQYKEAVDSTVIFSKTDPKGIITYVNDMFCEVSGYTKEELLGRSHNIIRHPEMPSEVFKEMWETIQSGQIWQGIVKNRAKNGHTYIVDSTIFPLFDHNGAIVEYMALRVDITFLSQKQSELEWREKLTSEILNNQESIVALTSKVQGLQQVNKRFFDYFDFKDLEDFRSRHRCICDLFIQEEGYLYSLPGEMAWVETPIKQSEKKHKVKLLDKLGQEKIFAIKTNRFTHNDEELFVVTLSDITELENAYRVAKSAETAKANFLANMSHEIRTPMNGISGFVELLAESGLNDEQKRYADIIKNSTNTLVGIVNDILDISKIESGKMALDLHPFDPVAEIVPALEIFETVAHGKGVDYITFIDPALPRSITADSLRLKQVMSNLIGNAIKFTPKGGYIYIVMEVAEKNDRLCRLRFSVRDSGIGIPREKQEEIFNAFSQADDSVTRKFGGTGLGLTISSNFVNLMDSELKVVSEENKGSTFFFDLDVGEFDTGERYAKFEKCSLYLSAEPEVNAIVLENMNRYMKGFGITSVTEGFDIALHLTKEVAQLYTPAFFVRRNETDTARVFEELKFSKSPLDADMLCIHRPVNAMKLHDALLKLLQPQTQQTQTSTAKKRPHYETRVLVAEDNEINQSLIVLLLEKHGIIPDIADNGEEAYYLFAKNRYELVLMDINMPVMDGLESTRKIRRYEQEQALPPCKIVALTANVMSEDRERFMAGGMDDYLTKPIEPVKLDAMLARHCTPVEKTQEGMPDIRELAEIMDIDEAYLLELLERFKGAVGGYLDNIKEAVMQKDQNAIFHAAHKLNGTAANFRFSAISALAQKIENQAKESADIHPELLERLTREVEKLHA